MSLEFKCEKGHPIDVKIYPGGWVITSMCEECLRERLEVEIEVAMEDGYSDGYDMGFEDGRESAKF